MPDVNEEIFDRSVRHQIGVQHVGSDILIKLFPVINKADRKIMSLISDRESTLAGPLASERMSRLLKRIAEINQEAHVELGAGLRKELRELVSFEAEFQKSLIEDELPEQVDVLAPAALALGAVVTGKFFEGRRLNEWLMDLRAARQRTIRTTVRRGMDAGDTARQIVRRLRGNRQFQFRDGILERNRRSLEALIRTSVTFAAGAARHEFAKANSRIIERVMWTAVLDNRTCAECAGLDGRTWPVLEARQPPAHANCRCTLVAVTRSWRALGIPRDDIPAGTRASMTGRVPNTTTYNDWLRNQSAKIQDEALGPTRGALFRRGGLRIDKFTKRNGDRLNLDQLRAREATAFKRAGIKKK